METSGDASREAAYGAAAAVWDCPTDPQRMSRLDRARAKAERLRMLLGDTGSLTDDRPLISRIRALPERGFESRSPRALSPATNYPRSLAKAKRGGGHRDRGKLLG